MALEETKQIDEVPTSGAQWLREDSRSLQQTKRGLNLFLSGIIFVFFAVLGVLYFQYTTDMLSVVMTALPVMGMTGNLLMLAGVIFCLAVPDEVGARGLLIGAAVGISANIIFSGMIDYNPNLLPMPVALFLKLAGYIGLILFALFQRRLLLYIGRPDQTGKVTFLILTTVLFLLGSWGMELVAYLELVEIASMTIYAVMLPGFFTYPCFMGSLKRALVPVN
ncbi:hypothetical protein Pan153_30020 [Gimesia panareensis]|uniref:Uncharacterized protein n=1 Tax=Gimesia panareensis TaxID=2527978 RepID=A0A518FPY9_9PLAN|nr:hypothetical protein [Gimesia panareensis]QDV18345.1 hypothetical protein Pan153_30020 [Gimesia panareensis]